MTQSQLYAFSPNWNGMTKCNRGGEAGVLGTCKLLVDKIAGIFLIYLSQLFLSSAKISEHARTLSPSHPLFLSY